MSHSKQNGFAILLTLGLMVLGAIVGMGTVKVVNVATNAASPKAKDSGCYDAYALNKQGKPVNKSDADFMLCPHKAK